MLAGAENKCQQLPGLPSDAPVIDIYASDSPVAEFHGLSSLCKERSSSVMDKEISRG
jgi:hypothetical protein